MICYTTVGALGIMAGGAKYLEGVEIPYVGEAIAVYGAGSLTWDVFYKLGEEYGASH